jgi:hypothetical protein
MDSHFLRSSAPVVRDGEESVAAWASSGVEARIALLRNVRRVVCKCIQCGPSRLNWLADILASAPNVQEMVCRDHKGLEESIGTISRHSASLHAGPFPQAHYGNRELWAPVRC